MMNDERHLVDARIERLVANPPLLHRDGAGNPANYGIDPLLVPYLREYVRPGGNTMETGSGISTIVFLLLGACHSSVTPNGDEAERILGYCREHGIPTKTYTPIVARSELALPALADEPRLEVALVDGNHAFPVPCLDWFYLTRILKQGGVMIVDDIQLWSGKILADFLCAEDPWQRLARTPRFAVYRLLATPDETLGRWWGQQPYVIRHSRSGRLWNRLRAMVR
jgi:hypothetical protein